MHARSSFDLSQLGWDEDRTAHLEANHPGLEPARVAVEHKGSYTLFTTAGETRGEITGRMRHETLLRSELPVVGDWVATRPISGERRATIEVTLPRRTSFSRDIAGLTTEEQVLAANVDILLILAGLDGDLSLRRLERFLTLAWQSGATPVVVLNKIDLCPDLPAVMDEVTRIAPGVDICPVSARDGRGLQPIRDLFGEGRTAALLGSSGVGKSTVINQLLGVEVMSTAEVRWDGKGKHTTTHRQLIPLPGGGCVIDTPGLRELRLWDADEGIEASFADIAELAIACRFSDCSHEHEPGCAVLQAVEDGLIGLDRLKSYQKLERELAALERKRNTHLAREQGRRFKKLTHETRTRSRQKW